MKNTKRNTTVKRRESISQLVFTLIRKNGLVNKHGKDGLVLVMTQVKKKFPKSKFKDTHYFWYLSRYRRQLREKLGTDCLHQPKEVNA